MRRRSVDHAFHGVLAILALIGAQCSGAGDQDTPDESARTDGPGGTGTVSGSTTGKGGGGSQQSASGKGGDAGNSESTLGAAGARAGGGPGASGSAGSRAQSAGSAGTANAAGFGGLGGGGGASATKTGLGDGGVGGAGGKAGGVGKGGSLGKGGGSGVGGANTNGAGGAGGLGRGGGSGAGGTGSAGGSGQTGDDGCTETQASNVTMKQIALYQSVKIPLMNDGTEVSLASRVSTVIQGRQSLFRVFVTPGTGWTAREISARLTLTSAGGAPVQYFSKKSISKASTESDRNSTFDILVPPSAMTEALRYSVSIVECGDGAGSGGQARFPATGDADLGVKKTGGLKIKVIPLKVNDLLPDTSQTALDAYAKEMMSMYPINAVDISVGDTLTVSQPLDWSTMADQIRAKRQKDNPPADYYYFGLVKPASTLTAYCKSACTLGIGLVVPTANQAYGRAAVGVGFADQYSWTTMAHEVGHNHGREHSPCAPSGSSISGVDPDYPYAKAALGTWGWDCDKNALFDPAKATDIMGYCDNQWISDYTYNGLVSRVAAVNGAAYVYTPASTVGKWRVLLTDEAKAPRWGVPIDEDTAADGTAETATIYNDSGLVLTTVTVYRMPFSDSTASMVLVPAPAPDWYAVQVPGSSPHPFSAPVTVPIP